ncbi:MAG: bifunctional folylpolyglutamate synthase/dihydrofolate synthase [Bacteroidales bacterium]|nr:bifunctional folylpolyglutamate synthase/dihydrofolate synthase [Bacteroidales bacterium]
MTYQETLDFMFSQLPMYHRIGAAAYKADIQPTIDMMTALGNPECKFKSIHVAGTNGKGSVSHFLASILQEAGYKVGLYTSPHLVDFRERIRINGEMIPQSAVVSFVDHHRDMFDKFNLSFFEMTVGLAFDYFAREQVDIAVIEVGMGGRLDSTNVITPLLSVITNIGLDHTQFLGDTLEKIAGEKAGIIKDGVPVVIGETQLETAPVFVKTAANHHAPITFADQHYVVDDISRYTEELTGEYQKKNIATVLEAVEVLRKTTDFELQPEAVRKGLAKVVTNTHLHGRWQKIGENPLTICETAHNAPGIDSMLGKLATMDYDNLHVVYGCVNDKDYRKILNNLNTEFSRLGKPFRWYFSQPSVPRGLPVADLLAAASEQGIEGKGYEKVKDAIAEARSTACKDDFVLVTGSIFLIADALA